MRVLFAIGCDTYQDSTSFASLSGAETDAKSIFEKLLTPSIGAYEESRSKLLLSPTLSELRSALKDVVSSTGERISTFTFFFAGHGAVSRGAFYMCVRDSEGHSLAMTALPLAEIFRILNEVEIPQSNIIVDACQSGGLINDLNVLLKPDLIGDSNTPAVTLLAMAAQNQYANEVGGSGVGTNALLDCITGRDFVQDSSPALDLVEIGRRLSEKFKGTDQIPVVWGLNLCGAPTFCRNVRFSEDPSAPFRFNLNQSYEIREAIRDCYENLWRAYDSVLSTSWEPLNLFSIAKSAANSISVRQREAVGPFIEQIANSFVQRASTSKDRYRQLQVLTPLAVVLLPFLECSSARNCAERLLNSALNMLQVVQSELLHDGADSKYALLSEGEGAGLADFYNLPIRVSKVLGWAAFGVLYSKESVKRNAALSQFLELIEYVHSTSPNAFAILNDGQAPYVAALLSSLAEIGRYQEGELLLGCYFHSMIECRGRVARHDIEPSRVLDYMLVRGTNNYSASDGLIEQPSESITVLLRSAKLFNLENVLDESLWKLDRLHMLAYVPATVQVMSDKTMEGGQNHLWTIGRDVFRVKDLDKSWPSNIPSSEDAVELALILMSAFLHSDRVPWHLLPGNPEPLATD